MNARRLLVLIPIWIILIAFLWPVPAMVKALAGGPVVLPAGLLVLGYAAVLLIVMWLAIRMLMWISTGAFERWLTATRSIRQNSLVMMLALATLWILTWDAYRWLFVPFRTYLTEISPTIVLASVAITLLIVSVAERGSSSLAIPEIVLSRLDTIPLKGIAVGASAAFIMAFALTSMIRLPFPFEIEWNEGQMLVEVARVLEGKPLYPQPSVHYIPFVYPPLYVYLAAGIAKLTGINFAALRLVSLLASLGSGALIYLLVYRETREHVAAVLAIGVFAASYPLANTYYDLARVDPLALCLFLAGVALLRPINRISIKWIAGIMLALSCLTKQTMIIPCVILLGYHLVRDRQRSLITGILFGMIGLAVFLMLNSANGGWFAYYMLRPGTHRLLPGMLVGFWLLDLMPLAIAMVLGVAGLVRSKHFQGLDGFYYPVVFCALILIAWLGRLTYGGAENALLPAFAGIALAFGLALPTVKQSSFVQLLIVLQFAALLYYPLSFIPTQRDTEAGMLLIERLRVVDGEVLIPSHEYLAMMAGKQEYAHVSALGELASGYGGEPAAEALQILEEMRTAIRNQKFDVIILNSTQFDAGYYDVIDEYYVPTQPIFDDDEVFQMRAGFITRPETWYIPRER